MAALVFAQAGWRPLVLGVDTPIAQIAALARDANLGAVALSCVQECNNSAAVRALRRVLPRRVPLVLGGRAAPTQSRLKGVEMFSDLASLDRWIRSRGG
jgi:hypothetical protein